MTITYRIHAYDDDGILDGQSTIKECEGREEAIDYINGLHRLVEDELTRQAKAIPGPEDVDNSGMENPPEVN